MTTINPAAEIAAARRAGKRAASEGRFYRDNPHRGSGSRDRVLARMWDAGFGSSDPINVDFSSHDAE